MSLSRSLRRTSFARPATRFASTRLPTTRIQSQMRYASDYGSGAGDPKGENPQDQGANPSADLEHPGPPPPKVGQGSGGGPTKGSSDGHSMGSKESRSAEKSEDKSKSSSSSSATKGAQPKILSESPPPSEEQSEEVKRHNADFENRAERPHEKVEYEDHGKDKVPKEFWKGQGGRDSDP